MAECLPDNESDEVLDYLLGRLTPAVRQQFEARLQADAALRQYVREVEQGVVALALAVPPRDVPAKAWENVEASVTRQVRRGVWFPFLRPGWLAGGWTVAGLAVAALIAQWYWFHSSPPQTVAPATTTAAVVARQLPVQSESTHDIHSALSASPVTVLPKPNISPESQTLQIVELRQEIARLEALVAQLQSATQSPPVASAISSRGIQLLPPIGLPSGIKTLSPQLQQAVLLAVAREMGWTLNPPPSNAAHSGGQDTLPPVNFVDLKATPDASAPANPSPTLAATEPDATSPVVPTLPATPATGSTAPEVTSNPTASGADAAGSSSGVSMLTWGNKLIAAIDPSTLPPSASAQVWTLDKTGNQQLVGNVPLGNGATVVTVSGYTADPSQQYYISAGTNIVGQFPAAASPP